MFYEHTAHVTQLGHPVKSCLETGSCDFHRQVHTIYPAISIHSDSGSSSNLPPSSQLVLNINLHGGNFKGRRMLDENQTHSWTTANSLPFQEQGGFAVCTMIGCNWPFCWTSPFLFLFLFWRHTNCFFGNPQQGVPFSRELISELESNRQPLHLVWVPLYHHLVIQGHLGPRHIYFCLLLTLIDKFCFE